MFQYDAARSGHNPTTTGPSGAVSIRWKQTIANATFGASPPVVNDGTVFVGGRGEAETLFALDASSGEVRWQVEKVGGFNSPAVAYDTVYAPATNSRLYAYDPADGSERWQFKADNEARHTAIADGRVYLGTSGSVFALDAGTGDELWRTSLNRTGNEFAHGGGRGWDAVFCDGSRRYDSRSRCRDRGATTTTQPRHGRPRTLFGSRRRWRSLCWELRCIRRGFDACA